MTISELRLQVASCKKCSIHSNGKPVLGDGAGKLLVIGEALGGDEIKLQKPFVGKAGQLLMEVFESAGLNRGVDYFITNIVKCRPVSTSQYGNPINRTPTPQEIQACLPYLDQTVDILKPEFILCVGAIASKVIISSTFSITSQRGEVVTSKRYKVPSMAVLHPAYILRQHEDFDRLKLQLKVDVFNVLNNMPKVEVQD